MAEFLNKNLIDLFDSEYVIPLYQRNFAWRDEEISQLLQDIYDSYKTNPDRNYYIGSLVVLKRNQDNDKRFEVIDGQQRLTVLSLLVKLLNICNEQKLFYDSRPEIENFLSAYYKADAFSNIGKLRNQENKNLFDAVKALRESRINESEEDQTTPITLNSLYKGKDKLWEELADYISHKVIILRIEIPDDTDVASYFEIMNNRGVQLQKHEILKSKILKKIPVARQSIAGKIWDACSQMEIPIQRAFNPEERKNYFGENYDEFLLSKDYFSDEEISDKKSIGISLEELLEKVKNNEENPFENTEINEDDAEDEILKEDRRAKYGCIIDFPNFLMHVFRVLYGDEYKSSNNDEELPLDEKHLITVYEKLSNNNLFDEKYFLYGLFKLRVIFDRFIIRPKFIDTGNPDTNYQWEILKPELYEYESRKSRTPQKRVVYKYTEFQTEKLSDLVIKAESMLQVTFRSRHHKKWLYVMLDWLYKNLQNESIAPFLEDEKNIDSFYTELNSYMNQYFQGFEFEEAKINDEDYHWKYEKAGTGTPHFLFNFIDYLYYKEFLSGKSEIPDIKYVKDFTFRYYNSVEHHLAQDYREKHHFEYENAAEYLDMLGNLILISKSTNSRLSDSSPYEKIHNKLSDEDRKSLSPNRRIIYSIVDENMKNPDRAIIPWNEKNIKKHYEDLLLLLSKRNEILDV